MTDHRESVDNKKRVEAILRMSENDQVRGTWAVTSAMAGNWYVGMGVHWWPSWHVGDNSVNNRSACAMVTQGDTVTGTVLEGADRGRRELWQRLCAGCCASFLKRGLG